MIELKHLSAYLPYELKAFDIRTKEIRTVVWTHFTYDLKYVGMNHLLCEGLIISEHKPILRPMSDFDAPLGMDNQFYSLMSKLNLDLPTESPIDRDLDFELDGTDRTTFYFDASLSLKVYDFLFENHFDVFGLIEQGIAISIHDLEK